GGLAAADELRDIDPERRARAAVAAAVELLGRAKALAGPNPRPEIAALLRDAEAHCEAAERALDADRWALALREAKACATHARRVILLLAGGVDDDELEARAVALVEEAAELHARAVALAGSTPPEPVARALDQAGT